MVQLDESEIELQWECPPCQELRSPAPDCEPPQQTVKPAAAPRPRPPSPDPQPVFPPTFVSAPAMPAAPQKAVKAGGGGSQTNGAGAGNTPGRLNFPTVKIRDLPFYPVQATLLRPCALTSKDSQDTQQQNLAFYLTQEQANMVNMGRKVESNGMVVYKIHILLRFTRMSADSVQDDDFPKNLCLKVNNKVCPLPNPKPVPANRPNMEAKRPPKPLIITSLCKLNTKSCLNQVSVTWGVQREREIHHTVSIYLVEKLSPTDLLRKLKDRGQRDPQITKAVIQSKLEDKDDEISTTSCKVSMACPLGMARMTLPCRASTCDHLQCFDADLYLKMNEKKPKWVCPVCNKPAYYEHLFLDGFYIQLLLSPKFKAITTNDIILNNDATWEPVEEVTLGVSDSDDDEDPLSVRPPPGRAAPLHSNGAAPVCTIDDDDISVIPISRMVDRDGAPVLTDTSIPSHLPVNTFLGPGAGRAGHVTTLPDQEEDNVLRERSFPPDTDYMDLNFSVKWFQYTREPPPPPRASPTPPLSEADPAQSRSLSRDSSESSGTDEGRAGRGRGGRGRGATRGNTRQRVVGGAGRQTAKRKEVELESEDDIEIPVKTVKGSNRGRGQPAKRARQPAKRVKGGGRQRRRVEESEEESESPPDSEEEEQHVAPPPPARTSGRPARNSRKITNYAAIEEAGDVLDYYLGTA